MGIDGGRKGGPSIPITLAIWANALSTISSVVKLHELTYARKALATLNNDTKSLSLFQLTQTKLKSTTKLIFED